MLAVSLSHSIKQKPVNSTARETGASETHLCSDKVGLLLAAMGERLTKRKDKEGCLSKRVLEKTYYGIWGFVGGFW